MHLIYIFFSFLLLSQNTCKIARVRCNRDGRALARVYRHETIVLLSSSVLIVYCSQAVGGYAATYITELYRKKKKLMSNAFTYIINDSTICSYTETRVLCCLALQNYITILRCPYSKRPWTNHCDCFTAIFPQLNYDSP